MKRRFDKNWLDDLKAAREAQAALEADDSTWFDEVKADAERQHNQRADDSEITATVAAAEPELARSQFRRAVRILEGYFETALDSTGPQKARQVLERIHQITGDRRRKTK